MPLIIVIIAVVLHTLLGWPLLIGSIIGGLILTAPGVMKLLSQPGALEAVNRRMLGYVVRQVTGGMLIGVALAYVPMVIAYFLTGHATW